VDRRAFVSGTIGLFVTPLSIAAGRNGRRA
jgi:hypothetical protein